MQSPTLFQRIKFSVISREIKASVIRYMLNTIEANRLGNHYVTGFTDANDLLSTLCTD